MIRAVPLLCGCAILLATFETHAQDRTTQLEAQTALYAAKSIRCVLGDGVHTTWSGGKPDRTLVPYATDASKATMVFDSIDLQRRVARLIGELGSTDVELVSAAAGLTFAELTPNGPNVTTVYAYYNSAVARRFLMVQSRHMVILPPVGTPTPSQYYGTCEVLQ